MAFWRFVPVEAGSILEFRDDLLMGFYTLVEKRTVNLPEFLLVSVALRQFVSTPEEQVEQLLVCLLLLPLWEAAVCSWKVILLDQSMVTGSAVEASGRLMAACLLRCLERAQGDEWWTYLLR
jgi:hypothetical protein